MAKIINLEKAREARMDEAPVPDGGVDEEATSRRSFEELPPPMQRALLEAQERRIIAEAEASEKQSPKEINGRGGLDPIRYGDWEAKGITSDF